LRKWHLEPAGALRITWPEPPTSWITSVPDTANEPAAKSAK
jgi:hypothetical protein